MALDRNGLFSHDAPQGDGDDHSNHIDSKLFIELSESFKKSQLILIENHYKLISAACDEMKKSDYVKELTALITLVRMMQTMNDKNSGAIDWSDVLGDRVSTQLILISQSLKHVQDFYAEISHYLTHCSYLPQVSEHVNHMEKFEIQIAACKKAIKTCNTDVLNESFDLNKWIVLKKSIKTLLNTLEKTPSIISHVYIAQQTNLTDECTKKLVADIINKSSSADTFFADKNNAFKQAENPGGGSINTISSKGP